MALNWMKRKEFTEAFNKTLMRDYKGLYKSEALENQWKAKVVGVVRGTRYNHAQFGCTRTFVQGTWTWSAVKRAKQVGSREVRCGALPLPESRAKKISPCCSTLFCYEAGRREPPPPSFNQPPIVKYEQRRPPFPQRISLLFSHTNCTTAHIACLRVLIA